MTAEARACSATVPPWIENPYRLVSLGEIMRHFDAPEMLESMVRLGHINARLTGPGPFTGKLDDGMRKLISTYENVSLYEEMGLILAAKTIKKIAALADEPAATWSDLQALWAEFRGRVIEGSEEVVFLYVEPGKKRLYSDANLFGEDVAKKFPSTTYDIKEASKCLALDRGTACVFHLMRIMERGLNALGNSLGDPSLDPRTNPTWSKILKRCTKELAKDLKDRSPEWRTEEPFYSGATARLMAVKDAWRNETMHVRGKYTEEEALDVWNHVKAFMALLATKLSEE